MLARPSTRAFLLKVYVLVPVLAASAAIAWAAVSAIPPMFMRRAVPRATPSPVAVRGTLIDAGLTADALCAAGVDPQSVSQVVTNGREYINAHPTELSDAQTNLASARQSLASMEERTRGGLASAEDIRSLQQLRTVATSTQSALDNARSHLFAAAIAGLPDPQRTLLAHIRANAQYHVPVQYKVVDRTPAEWTRLTRAIQARTVADRRSEQPPPELRTVLASANEQPDVVTAAANITQRTVAVRTSWNAALSQ